MQELKGGFAPLDPLLGLRPGPDGDLQTPRQFYAPLTQKLDPPLAKELTLKQIKGQGHGMVHLYHDRSWTWIGLVTRIMHAKYKCSTINNQKI